MSRSARASGGTWQVGHARLAAAAGALALAAGAAGAQDGEEALAKQLSNPVSTLVSVPLQLNHDRGYGAGRDGHKTVLNIQPVVPFALNAEWNLISRTIVPVVVEQRDVVPGSRQSGIGDVNQSLFFSPAKPSAGGLVWGAGPVLLLPTGSSDSLSARQWALGPTVVVVRQDGPWTFGLLANHLWSVAGDSDRARISSTFVQPFFAHTTKTAWTFTLNTESTYDWKARQWSVPLQAQASKLVKLGQQPMSFGAGVRYWAEGPDGGPHGWGFRFVATLLFPK